MKIEITYLGGIGKAIAIELSKCGANVTLMARNAEKLKKTIRIEASPRHVPAKIIEVSDIPRTKNGKIVELAVKNIIDGNKIKNIEALANPNALKQFKNLKQLKI